VGPWFIPAARRTIEFMSELATEAPTSSTQHRHAGPIALGTGLLFAALDLGRLPIAATDDRAAILRDPLVAFFNAAYFFGFCGLVLALVGLHGRQARQAGTFGGIAFAFAVVGTMAMAGDMWFDGFAAPWLAEVAPQVFTTAKPTAILQVGALLSYALIALGWLLFGLASLRAQVYPAAAALALAAGGLVAFQSGFPPYGVPLGLAVAALGGWLIRSDRAAASAAAASR
jgi:hypothetical protein